MSFSGSRNYTDSYTAANVIKRALQHMGVLDASESVDSTEEADALVQLNLLLKEWSVEGADVFTRQRINLFLTLQDSDGYSTASSASYFSLATYATQLASAASSGASSVTVDSDDSISDTDIVIVELDDNTLDADVVNGSPAANVVTLTGTLASAAAADRYVYSFPAASRWQSQIVDVISATRIQEDTSTWPASSSLDEREHGIRSPLSIIGSDEYQRLGQQIQDGAPNSINVLSYADTNHIRVWPTGGGTRINRVELLCAVYLQDLDATTNNIDLLPGGFNALTWCLADELSSEYGLSVREQDRIARKAARKRELYLSFAVEDADVQFTLGGPDR